MEFELLYPQKIVFGCGAAEDLPAILPLGSKVLLTTGKSAVSSGVAAEIADSLSKDHTVIDASGLVVPEPPLDNVNQLVEIGRSEKATAVVAVGGGSAIDAAKAAAAIIPLEGAVSDYFYGKRTISKKGLFMAALPTTAGTGAEITKNSVLTDPEKRIKKSLRSPFMVPDAAVVDPDLTLSAPPSVTAASGMDAFVQALESFTSTGANPITRSLAKHASTTILSNLVDAYKNGADIEKRTAMAEGSLASAMAFSQSGLGAAHGLAHPIGVLLKVPHGVACSILIEPVMRFNLATCASDYAELAREMEPPLRDKDDESAAMRLIEMIASTRGKLDIPANFESYGLAEKHFDFIIANCRGGSMDRNPLHVSDDDARAILLSLVG